MGTPFPCVPGAFQQWERRSHAFPLEMTPCCVLLAPDSFVTGMDWLLDRTVESCSIGVAFGHSSITDLDFADDVSLLAELLELLVPILETIASEAASVGFQVNWQKTNVQSSGPGRHGSRVICLPWLSYPLINRKHL